jgi:DMSO/TMAO reductase YedYZ molybdopterin-dependent catalytic subunit
MLNRRQFLVSLAGIGMGINAPLMLPPAPTGAAEPPFLTPNQAFFRFHYSRYVPHIRPQNWRFSLGGWIKGGAVRLPWSEVARLPLVEKVATLECIGNPPGGPLIGQARWQGFAARDLLRFITPQPEVRYARLIGADGYVTAVEINRLLHPDSLLTYGMNGQALTADQGYPLRLILPGLYGQKMVKWIERIELIPHPFWGFWERQGWSDQALVQPHAIIRFPQEGARWQPPLLIQGLAVSGTDPITAVEVQIDQQPWQRATLTPTGGWVAWSLPWLPQREGISRLRARVVSAAGLGLPLTPTSHPKPHGYGGEHQIFVQIG